MDNDILVFASDTGTGKSLLMPLFAWDVIHRQKIAIYEALHGKDDRGVTDVHTYVVVLLPTRVSAQSLCNYVEVAVKHKLGPRFDACTVDWAVGGSSQINQSTNIAYVTVGK